MKRIFFFTAISILTLASCKKTKIIDNTEPLATAEPASYLIDKPTDTLTREFLNKFCYGGYTDDLIGQRITNNKGKLRVYLVPCPLDVVTPDQVRKYLTDNKYSPLGPGYLLALVNTYVTTRGVLISALDCKDLKMRDNDGTWKPLKELMFQKSDLGSGCITGFPEETGSYWNLQVLYLCEKKK